MLPEPNARGRSAAAGGEDTTDSMSRAGSASSFTARQMSAGLPSHLYSSSSGAQQFLCVSCDVEGDPAWQIKNRINDIIMSGPDARERVMVDLTNFENIITEHTVSVLFLYFPFPNTI